jgi:hypothetical protein
MMAWIVSLDLQKNIVLSTCVSEKMSMRCWAARWWVATLAVLLPAPLTSDASTPCQLEGTETQQL